MQEDYQKKRISKEVHKIKKLDKERIEISKDIIKNLKIQKKIEKEHLDLVDQHQNYWKKELEKTRDRDIERYKDLKERLKMEEEIRNKILEHIKYIDKEIKIHNDSIKHII